MRIFSFLLGIAEANAFLTYKKWHNNAYNISHFDFRRELAHEMLNGNFSIIENSEVKTRSNTSQIQHNLETFQKKRKDM
ncbi:9174_t:CDS:1, partial [Gigaspora rosea]